MLCFLLNSSCTRTFPHTHILCCSCDLMHEDVTAGGGGAESLQVLVAHRIDPYTGYAIHPRSGAVLAKLFFKGRLDIQSLSVKGFCSGC